MFMIVFLVGFVLGVIAVLCLEAFGVLFLIEKLSQKTRKTEQSLAAASEDVDNLLPLDLDASPKQGDIWVLESEKVPKNWSDKIPKEQERKQKLFEVSPVRKQAKIKDDCLILTEPDGSLCSIQLKGCVVEAISATNLPSRKWAKRYPIKLQSQTSAIYKGSNTLYIYLDTAWEKESWCRVLRLASCDDHMQLSWFSKLQEEYKSYLGKLLDGYPSFMKPQSGVYTEAMDRELRADGSSKVRVMWKKLARKVAKAAAENNMSAWASLSGREELRMNERVRGHQDSASSMNSGRSAPAPGLPPRCGSLPHARSQSNISVISDTELEDRNIVDEGTLCCNLLISRLFFDIKKSEMIMKFIQDRIQRSLSNMRTPNYIGEVICTNIDPGNLPPHIHSMRVLPLDMNEVWAFEIDIEYSGGIVLDIETRIEVQEVDLSKELAESTSESSVLLEEFEKIGNQLNMTDVKSDQTNQLNVNAGSSSANIKSKWKSFINSVAKQVSQVPISLRIRVASLRGTIRLHIKPPPSDQLWFCFSSMPEIDFNLESSVGEHKITNSHIALFLISRFKASIREMMVAPNCENVWVPFMTAEQDDWLPRNAAPFIQLNHEPASTPEKPSSSQPVDVRQSTSPSRDTDHPESIHQKPKLPECEQPQPPSSSSSSDASPNTTVISRESQALQDLKTPLLIPSNENQEERHEGKEIPVSESSSRSVSQSPSRSVSMSSHGSQGSLHSEDDGKLKKLGRRARMLDLGKKMGEKIEEKRRHIEEKGRNIVEKMRAT